MTCTRQISTHTPLAGRDFNDLTYTISEIQFLLTRPLRDVTIYYSCLPDARYVFLLTRPLRDVTTMHVPSDPVFHISTHTPLAGRDSGTPPAPECRRSFLLTRPLRDVT